jgi:hypothetical protein
MAYLVRLLVAGAAAGVFAAPAAAQYPYPQPGYGYPPAYDNNPVGQVIDQLLGNRYNVTDRQAVRQCASAAMQQASAQYGSGGGYDRGWRDFRVTAITDVQRRTFGLRVKGLLSSGGGYGYGDRDRDRDYRNQLSFRCNVDYRGNVTNVRLDRDDRDRDDYYGRPY